MRISLTGRHLKDVRRRVRALVAAPVVEVGVDEAAAVSAMVAELLDRPREGERVRHVAAEVEAARLEATLEESLAFVGDHELRQHRRRGEAHVTGQRYGGADRAAAVGQFDAEVPVSY